VVAFILVLRIVAKTAKAHIERDVLEASKEGDASK
jgi:hypothetical protein